MILIKIVSLGFILYSIHIVPSFITTFSLSTWEYAIKNLMKIQNQLSKPCFSKTKWFLTVIYKYDDSMHNKLKALKFKFSFNRNGHVYES